MKREWADDPSVHRALFVVDPPQMGRDVANLQRALRARLRARGITPEEMAVATHGHFTHATWVACVEVGHWLGLRSDTYLKTRTDDSMPDGRAGVCTEGAQRIIRMPDERTDEQLERARVRQEGLDGSPKFEELLVQESDGQNAETALSWARRQLGTTERPAGSNWGPKIETWIRATGYSGPVPWCGCFVNAAVIQAGVPSGSGWIGYTPAIVTRAKQGFGGWRWIGQGDGRRGDLALFDTPGGDPAVHVGIVTDRLSPSLYHTIEGNTSSGSAGSQANGGGVYQRRRSTVGHFRIIGFARPPYKE